MASLTKLMGHSREEVLAKAEQLFTDMAPELLIAQQIVLRGAMHALRDLLDREGDAEENAAIMLNDIAVNLTLVHGIARKRGINLPVFSETLTGAAAHSPNGKVS